MKKSYLALCIVMWCLVPVLIPLNLYVVSVSDAVVWAAGIAVAASAVLFVIKGNASVKGKITVSIISTAVYVGFVCAGVLCNPYWNSIFLHGGAIPESNSYYQEMSSEDALEDLEYAMKYLRKLHPVCYRGLPPEIEDKYEEVKASISTEDVITVNELARYIESIFAIIGDGHTYASVYSSDSKYLKYWYEWDINGYSIAGINGQTIAQILDEKSTYYSFEDISYEAADLKNDIISTRGLDYLGYDVNSGITYTFENDFGEVREATYYADDYVTIDEYWSFNNVDRSSEDEEESFVSYVIDEEHDVAVLILDECIINDEYRNTVREMFSEVKAKGISNVAVDVRNNPGGNDGVVSEFLRYIDVDRIKISTCEHRLGFLMIHEGISSYRNDKYTDLLFHGNLYILTTPVTFSSAMIFAEYVRDNDLGVIIGTAPGNDPNGYGDVAFFACPNSRIFFQISTKKWYRADINAPEGLIEPDIECDIRLRDDAMEALYEAIG